MSGRRRTSRRRDMRSGCQTLQSRLATLSLRVASFFGWVVAQPWSPHYRQPVGRRRSSHESTSHSMRQSNSMTGHLVTQSKARSCSTSLRQGNLKMHASALVAAMSVWRSCTPEYETPRGAIHITWPLIMHSQTGFRCLWPAESFLRGCIL